MTAWNVLIANSTLAPANIAWDHLNNQAGGGTGTLIIGGLRTVNMKQSLSANATQAHSVNVQQTKLTADKPVSLSASINQKLEAEICQ